MKERYSGFRKYLFDVWSDGQDDAFEDWFLEMENEYMVEHVDRYIKQLKE